jgi:hypothetical protein
MSTRGNSWKLSGLRIFRDEGAGKASVSEKCQATESWGLLTTTSEELVAHEDCSESSGNCGCDGNPRHLWISDTGEQKDRKLVDLLEVLLI